MASRSGTPPSSLAFCTGRPLASSILASQALAQKDRRPYNQYFGSAYSVSPSSSACLFALGTDLRKWKSDASRLANSPAILLKSWMILVITSLGNRRNSTPRKLSSATRRNKVTLSITPMWRSCTLRRAKGHSCGKLAYRLSGGATGAKAVDSTTVFFHEYGRRVGMVPRSSLKEGKNSQMVEKRTRTTKTNQKQTNHSPQAESPPSCSLSSVLGETSETKTNDYQWA